jgi:carbon monoxide dehydrogenase subunit G
MDLNDALRLALPPSVVWEALQDLALLRASLDHCESFNRLSQGEFALTLMVPLGPLRARYEVRAHAARENPAHAGVHHRVLSFRARADGIGSLRGRIDVALSADERTDGRGEGTRIDYAVWATLAGPLAALPPRQIESALHELTDAFFNEFCAVVLVQHGLRPNRARNAPARRQHVFLRPISLAGVARRTRLPGQASAGALTGRATQTLFGSRTPPRASREERPPHALPQWGWAVLIVLIALLLYATHWLTD